MPRGGWACGPWLLGLRVQSLCSAMGEAAAVGGPRTTKKPKNSYMSFLQSCGSYPTTLIRNCSIHILTKAASNLQHLSYT